MKTKPFISFSAILLILAAPLRILAEDASLPTLIVAPLTADLSQIQGWQPALGQGLAEMLTTELTKMNKFQVLENTQLGALGDEIKLGESGFVSAAEKVDKGGWSGADFLFSGKVTRFGNKNSRIDLGGFVPKNFGNLGVKQTMADVRIDWRIVDVANRKVIKAGSAVGEQKGGGFDVGVNVNGSGGKIGFDNQEFMNSALGRATVTALNAIMADVTLISVPASARQKSKAAAAEKEAADKASATQALKATAGKVLAAPTAEVVIVSLGSQQGFKSGDTLNVFELNEVKDDKGTVVFSDEKLVGEAVLQTVQQDRSKAAYKGSAPVKAGWVVRAK
ncbi:MAG TPA: CsgG/HfaB family protein [Verrucomicrobiae bacterium]|nr:CsgG/HfaB family protein [Verrucomicrobiae bacterium]